MFVRSSYRNVLWLCSIHRKSTALWNGSVLHVCQLSWIGCRIADVVIDRSIEVWTGDDVDHRFHQNSHNFEKVRQLLSTVSWDMRDSESKNLEILTRTLIC